MDAGFNRVDYFDKNTIKFDVFINFLSNNKGLAIISQDMLYFFLLVSDNSFRYKIVFKFLILVFGKTQRFQKFCEAEKNLKVES